MAGKMDFAAIATGALHAHNKAAWRIAPAVVACTGGGNTLSAMLLNVPGASASILSIVHPYSRAAAAHFTCAPAKEAVDVSVSQSSAIQLARGALNHANTLALCEARGLTAAAASSWAAGRSLLPLPTCVGIACTASLAAEGKKGPHRAFIATTTGTHTHVLAVNLPAAERVEEDRAVSSLAVAALAQACHVPVPEQLIQTADTSSIYEPSWLQLAGSHLGLQVHSPAAAGPCTIALPDTPGNVAHARWTNTPLLTQLLQPPGDETPAVRSVLCVPPSAAGGSATCLSSPALPPGTVVLPGSFNPLHAGHEKLAAAALQLLQDLAATEGGAPQLPHPPSGLVVFELSATNADKPPMQEAALGARLAQFVGGVLPSASVGAAVAEAAAAPPPSNWPQGGGSYRSGLPAAVVVTDAPLFVQKGPLFPGCVFVLGVDTVLRLVDAKYYGGDTGAMLLQLGGLLHHQCRVLVAGRVMDKGPAAGKYLGLCDVLSDIPAALHPLFIELPADAFRADVSSSQLRANAGSADVGNAAPGAAAE